MAISQVLLFVSKSHYWRNLLAVLVGWWASCCTRGTAGSCWSARRCASSSSGTLHLENRLAIRSRLHNVLKIILEANISKQVHEIFLKLISQTGACNICNPGARLPLSLPQHGAHCSGSSYAWARYIMRKKNYYLFVVEMPDMLSDVLVFWVLWNKLIISARDASLSENW